MHVKGNADMISGDLATLREMRPLVHNITNFVAMEVSANALLSLGASPVMAHAPEEVEAMTSLAGALVLNIGTLTREWVASMILAGKKANELGCPVILDPVGSGATPMRTDAAKQIVEDVNLAMIRGNASEILSLCTDRSTTKGVDSVNTLADVEEKARAFAEEAGTVVAISGEVDFVTDGERTRKIYNGVEMMTRVTGLGCALTAITGAFCAVQKDIVEAAVDGFAVFGICGEMAFEKAKTPGSFAVAFLDALAMIGKDDIHRRLRMEG